MLLKQNPDIVNSGDQLYSTSDIYNYNTTTTRNNTSGGSSSSNNDTGSNNNNNMVSAQGALKTEGFNNRLYSDYVKNVPAKPMVTAEVTTTTPISHRCADANIAVMNQHHPHYHSSALPNNSEHHQWEDDAAEYTDDDEEESDIDSDTEEMQRILAEPDFEERMNYVFRLGYNKEQLVTVWKKIGPSVKEKDVLLNELVKLVNSTKISDEDSVDLYPNSSQDPAYSLLSASTTPTPSESESYSVPSNSSSSTGAEDDSDNLRMIVIDGSNVAMLHGNREVFSCKGIQYTVDYFKQRGHKKIKVFVPHWRKEASRKDAPITDQEILTDLEKEKILLFTPARMIKGKRVACYDDRYILKTADTYNGVVVSNDTYRDLLNENDGFKKVIEERLLMYNFVEDKFMPPDDPLGRHGPSLDNFLRKTPTAPETLPPNCPYGKKCTYGNKCKYYHPERGNMPHKTVTEKLAERVKLQEKAVLEAERNRTEKKVKPKNSLARTKSRSTDEVDGFIGISQDSEEKKQHTREYNEKLDKFRLVIENSSSGSSSSNKVTSLPCDGRSDKIRMEILKQAENNSTSSSRNKISSLPLELELETQAPVKPVRYTKSHSMAPSVDYRCDPNVQTHSLSSQFQHEILISGHLQVAKKLSDDANKDAEKKSQNASPSVSQHPTLCRQKGIVEADLHLKMNSPMKKTPHVANQCMPNISPVKTCWNPQLDYRFSQHDSLSHSISYTEADSYPMSPPPFMYPQESYGAGQPYSPHVARHASLPNCWLQGGYYSQSYHPQMPEQPQIFYDAVPSPHAQTFYTCPVTTCSSSGISMPPFLSTQTSLPSPNPHYNCYQQQQHQQHQQQQQHNPHQGPPPLTMPSNPPWTPNAADNKNYQHFFPSNSHPYTVTKYPNVTDPSMMPLAHKMSYSNSSQHS